MVNAIGKEEALLQANAVMHCINCIAVIALIALHCSNANVSSGTVCYYTKITSLERT